MDIATLEIIKNYLISSAEEMGVALRRSSFSPNIKERMDHSCAVFDREGRMVAQAEHIPVHLGAMPASVQQILKDFPVNEMGPGDTYILNDPYRGGTHLPDITLITPVFYRNELIGFTASRAHHADVGGLAPGSMSSQAYEIFQEGLRIPPVRLVTGGVLLKDVYAVILANVRTPKERTGDLSAQIAANSIGAERMEALAERYGLQTLLEAFDRTLNYSEALMRRQISTMPKGTYEAVDYLDDDGFSQEPININTTVTISDDKLTVDFAGTHSQVRGPVNAVEAVTRSAVYYVVRTVTDPSIPANQGLYRPLGVRAPEGTVVNAKFPAAVAGGNVETSQRIVDALYLAFSKAVPDKVPAASSGSMTNIAIGGLDHRTGAPFAYYETIAGGSGAGPNHDGVNAVHTHMTNTMNTPVEVIEQTYPLTIQAYEIRRGTGGRGRRTGGNGVRRIYRIECPETAVAILSDRRRFQPWGLHGGEGGKPGRNLLVAPGGEAMDIPSKGSIRVKRGATLVMDTPGGGGYGSLGDL
ncbi:MAG: hydantoinase B/oxoprolinase family protein [Candidatus Bathyarchaeia archaeon]